MSERLSYRKAALSTEGIDEMKSDQFPVGHGILVALLFLAACDGGTSVVPAASETLVIAHRGASGYLPEHTIAAKAMAYAQGADFIEQDLVMTQDDAVIVLHDHHLDTVSNVASIFPGRARGDGRYYAIDFTLAEIRELSVTERFELQDGVITAVFPERFPINRSTFRVHTFAEEIELVQGLNRSTGRSVGIYPEIKSPAFHLAEGKDISRAVLDVLKTYDYTRATDMVFLQCFDPYELVRIRQELLPTMNMDVRLVQLIAYSKEFAAMTTAEGIQKVSAYAAGIGPSMHLLIDPDSDPGNLEVSGLLELAHDAGLKVHPYTFRRERNQIPAYAKDYEDLLDIFVNELGVDGVFTDFPDRTVRFLENAR